MIVFHITEDAIDAYWFAWDELGFWDYLGMLDRPLG